MANSKYKVLYDLGEDRLLEMEAMLREGREPKDVAQTMLKAGDFFKTDLTQPKAERLIASYKHDVMDRALMRTIESSGILRIQKLAPRLNLVEETMLAVAAQRDRFERALTMADRTPQLLIEQHGKEGERYLKMLGEAARLQMDLGIVPKVPRRVTGRIMRDANNPNVVRFEMTEETLDAANEVEALFAEELLALPAG